MCAVAKLAAMPEQLHQLVAILCHVVWRCFVERIFSLCGAFDLQANVPHQRTVVACQKLTPQRRTVDGAEGEPQRRHRGLEDEALRLLSSDFVSDKMSATIHLKDAPSAVRKASRSGVMADLKTEHSAGTMPVSWTPGSSGQGTTRFASSAHAPPGLHFNQKCSGKLR